MTASKHLKQLVRARMARTGESYTAARRHVVRRAGTVALTPSFVIAGHGRHGQAVAFSADGAVLASGGQDAAVRFWHATDGSAAFALEGHEQVVNDVVLLDHHDMAVSASSDRTIRVWELSRHTDPRPPAASRPPSPALRAVLRGHRGAVTTLAALPGSSGVVSAGYDSRLRWWDIATGECRHEVRSALHRIADVAVVPALDQVLQVGTASTVVIHDLASGAEVQRVDTGSTAVSSVAVAPDGDVVATAGYDGAITLWAVPEWEPLRRFDVGARASAVAISPDGRLLAVAWDGHVGLWTLEADTPVDIAELPITGVYAVAFSPDGRRLAQTGADGKVRCWSLR